MTQRVLIFVTKKAGVSFADFKEKYEKYVNYITEVAGDAAPARQTRRYLTEGPNDKALVLAGNADAIDFHLIVEVEFEGESGFANFAIKTGTEEIQAKIKADQSEFIDQSKITLLPVGEVLV